MPCAEFSSELGAWTKRCANKQCPVGIYVGVKDQAASDEIFERQFSSMEASIDGFHSWCRSCGASLRRRRDYVDREALLAKQDVLCAICGRGITFRYRGVAHVDHCHNT